MPRKNWKQWELDYLNDSLDSKPRPEIERKLGRSWRAICQQARNLNLDHKIPRRQHMSIFDHCRCNSRVYKLDLLLRTVADLLRKGDNQC
ncbi:Uncharacterised protein [Serratia entomophila]|nr:Uncharacterised protein [Serratia entomophila]CAI0822645.1 Uncharacterised protein [Serratia entomophila]CAI0843321.1 Uncharacterised protein [Serratia entomophila]CAI0870875.1 Uncharacterised protein [Serratia entomophila]CAI0897093.1 Uncharacterised protein [Serratia entomophila]